MTLRIILALAIFFHTMLLLVMFVPQAVFVVDYNNPAIRDAWWEAESLLNHEDFYWLAKWYRADPTFITHISMWAFWLYDLSVIAYCIGLLCFKRNLKLLMIAALAIVVVSPLLLPNFLNHWAIGWMTTLSLILDTILFTHFVLLPKR